MFSKKLKQLQVQAKKYHVDYKESKSLMKGHNYQLFLSKHVSNKRKYINVKIQIKKDAQLQDIKQFMDIYFMIKDCKQLCKIICWTVLQENNRKSKERYIVIVYQFVEISLHDLISFNKCKNKEESLGIVNNVLQGFMKLMKQLQDIRGIDLNCISFDSKLIGFNCYTSHNQQLKYLYLPLGLLDPTNIFQKQFKRQIYSSSQLRKINKSQLQQHNIKLYPLMQLQNIIIQSERQTQDQHYNRQILQKIGLFVLKLLYILCQELDIKEEEFNLYTMNQSFIIDFNWNLINQFLQECYKHKDYVMVANIIHYLVAGCHQENHFAHYYSKVHQIKNKIHKISHSYNKNLNYQLQEHAQSLYSKAKPQRFQQSPKRQITLNEKNNKIYNIRQLLPKSTKQDYQPKHQKQQITSIFHNQHNYKPVLQNISKTISGRRFQKDKNSQLHIQENNSSIQKLHDLLNNSQERIKSQRQINHHNHDELSQLYHQKYQQSYLKKKDNSQRKIVQHNESLSTKKNIKKRLEQLQEFIINNDKITQLKYSDGSKYVGQFNKGMREGLGIYYFVQGQVYGGEWYNNQMTGKGVYFFINQQEIYQGQVQCGIKSGFGIYHYKNGNQYNGEWSNDVKEGYGQLKDYQSGQIYCGQFKNNNKHGKGRIIYNDNSKFDGNFFNGMRQGQGLFYDQDNRLYLKSYWKNDSMQTYAEIFFNNGDYYNGQILNNLMHGRGIYRYLDGTVYEGQFIDNFASGQGSIHYDNGDIYEGMMLMGNFQGKGRYEYVHDKLIYDGDWKMNKQSGQAQYLYNNTQRLNCTMKNGQLLKYSHFDQK